MPIVPLYRLFALSLARSAQAERDIESSTENGPHSWRTRRSGRCGEWPEQLACGAPPARRPRPAAPLTLVKEHSCPPPRPAYAAPTPSVAKNCCFVVTLLGRSRRRIYFGDLSRSGSE
ncbi:hypothetical protein EVAR_18520_1 [Eumeta japonica]|uniref:Secreted protein n=1 Tax=Eumeta variegata TaxID=151549 RepID=A0A4C1UZT0_EUMVA|nr:hypothetical protein EVAR_18520_1 [Eumeta japonica]